MKPQTATILKRIGKSLLWFALALVLLFLGLITQLIKILAPERLTPLVEQVAESYLDADVNTSRVELTFWSTFPRLTIEVDSLEIVSNPLKQLSAEQRAQLPAGADTLLTFRKFDGGINMLHLVAGTFTIYDVNLDEPMINLVKYNDSVNNYDILKIEEDTTAIEIPNFAIDCFRITNARPWRYTSVSDSISGSVQLTDAQMVGTEAPSYRLTLGGDFASPLLKEYNFDNLTLGVNGQLKWDRAKPSAIAIEDFTLAIDKFRASINAVVDMSEDLKIESGDIKIGPIDIDWLTSHCPPEYLEMLQPFATNMTVGLSARLTAPYNPADSTRLPSFEATLSIPDCYVNTGAANITTLALDASINFDGSDAENPSLTLKEFALNLGVDSINVPWIADHAPADVAKYITPLSTNMSLNIQGRLTSPYCFTDTTAIPGLTATLDIPECQVRYGQSYLKRFALNTEINIDGNDADLSEISLHRLLIEGPATRLDIDGNITYPLSDPLIKGTLKGRINLSDFPPQIRRLLPVELSGRLTADASFDLRQSYLTPKNFHRVKLRGTMDLNDFLATAPGDSVATWINHAQLKLGTSEAFIRDNFRADSLLTVSLKIDTATFHAPGVEMQLADFKGGVGSANRSTSSDTTQINPIAGKLSLKRLVVVNHDDSTRFRLRNAVIAGSLRRYQGGARVPQLGLLIQAGRASMSSPEGRCNLRDADFRVTAHLNPKKKLGAKTQAIYDSLAIVHPSLPPDSLLAMAREIRNKNRRSTTVDDNSDYIDFGLDNSTKNLLRRWEVRGELKAARGRVFTPYFPLRNTLRNVDCTFSLDTVNINNIYYKVGQTDFTAKGSVTNLRRALTSRRRRPLNIELTLKSDTIQVNELTRAIFVGGAYAAGASKTDVKLLMSDDVSEAELDKAMSADNDTVSGPLLVPINVDASLRVNADNIVYSDMVLHDFNGDINMHEGALNLNRLSARTDIGSVGFTALYSAPDPQNMDFGFSMDVKDFHIGKFMNLFPALDTVMPMLSEMDGIINAEVAATTQIDTLMNIDLPTLRAAVKIEGDSLVLLDAETFRTLSKWLMFKNKKRNMIDHMSVEMVVENSQLELYPFMFDIDRYRLGVMGRNDMAMNLDYHISVLKSPLPFKFGINIKGTFDDMKIRAGGAKFKENMVYERVALVDTTRINLVKQIENVFRRGVRTARLGKLQLPKSEGGSPTDETPDDAAVLQQYNAVTGTNDDDDGNASKDKQSR